MALRHVAHVEAGVAKQGAGPAADLLGVLERTGIVIGDGERHRGVRQAQIVRGQQLGNVVRDGGDGRGLFPAHRVAGEQPSIILDHGAATRRVDDHRVQPAPFQFGVPGIDIARRRRARHVRLAHMQGEGAAAAGFGRDNDLDAVAGQQPERRRVDLRRERLLDAALEQGDAHPPCPLGRVDAGEASPRRQGGGRQVGQGAQAAGQQGPERPGQPRQTGHAGKARRVGDGPGDQPAQQPVAEGAAVVVLDKGAGDVGEMEIVDVDGAGRHAGVAGQARIDMADRLRIGPAALLQHRPDQVDPPARRLVLVPGQHIGRAHRRAEAVMHAGPQDPVRRGNPRIGKLGGGEGGFHG